MKEEQSLARELPRYTIEGTAFIVDIRLNELREVDAPWNRISLDDILEDVDGRIGLLYDLRTKNVATEPVDPENIPEHIKVVIFPPILDLDPVGWARKYGLADDAFTKNDVVKINGLRSKEKQEQQQKRKKRKGKGL